MMVSVEQLSRYSKWNILSKLHSDRHGTASTTIEMSQPSLENDEAKSSRDLMIRWGERARRVRALRLERRGRYTGRRHQPNTTATSESRCQANRNIVGTIEPEKCRQISVLVHVQSFSVQKTSRERSLEPIRIRRLNLPCTPDILMSHAAMHILL